MIPEDDEPAPVIWPLAAMIALVLIGFARWVLEIAYG